MNLFLCLVVRCTRFPADENGKRTGATTPMITPKGVTADIQA